MVERCWRKADAQSQHPGLAVVLPAKGKGLGSPLKANSDAWLVRLLGQTDLHAFSPHHPGLPSPGLRLFISLRAVGQADSA